MISTSKTLDERTAALRAARLARDANKPKPAPRGEHHRVIGLRSELPFGKYRGRTVEDVMDDDLGYITWMMESTEVEFGTDVEAEYRARLDPRRPRGAWAE